MHLQEDNICIYYNKKGLEFINQLIINNKYSSIFILADENTNDFCLPKFIPNLTTEIPIEIIEIEAGEEIKNINTCAEIWSILSDLGADRKSLLINLGGGVITDIGGFVASTYKRGIDFIHVPTTLLGMVDAAIGGKNGVDLNNLKNQIGVIKQPAMVLIDTDYLNTLPQNEMRSGLAEMLKHGLIHDKNYWDEFKSLSDLTTNNLGDLIKKSIEIKTQIVKSDVNENGIRKNLNFGHTLGHAIESYFLNSEKRILHGEAVAIGMILESYISYRKELISHEEFMQIKNLINSIYSKQHFSKNDIEEIIKLLVFDKKNEYGMINFVLLDGIGKCKINQVVDNELIIESFLNYLE